jgi:hypothetical protein
MRKTAALYFRTPDKTTPIHSFSVIPAKAGMTGEKEWQEKGVTGLFNERRPRQME